jgi:hypothetical protein
MAIYTGNNGRVYIARRAANGVSGNVTRPLLGAVGSSPAKAITKGQELIAITATGKGNGAVYVAGRTVLSTDTNRDVQFTVKTTGSNYNVGDAIYLARYNGAAGTYERMVGTFTLNANQIIGISDETEFFQNDYRVAKIRDWSYNSNSEVIETTALGDIVKTFAPSITSGDGSATLMFYEDDLNAYGAGTMTDIYELVDILFPRDVAPSVVMSLAVDGSVYNLDATTQLPKNNFTFNAYITSASVSASYGEVVTVNTSFTVDGPLIDVPWKPGVTRV